MTAAGRAIPTLRLCDGPWRKITIEGFEVARFREMDENLFTIS